MLELLAMYDVDRGHQDHQEIQLRDHKVRGDLRGHQEKASLGNQDLQDLQGQLVLDPGVSTLCKSLINQSGLHIKKHSQKLQTYLMPFAEANILHKDYTLI